MKTNFKKIVLLSFAFMLVLSCSQEFLNPENRNVRPPDSRNSQAQALFKAAGENICIPHILSSVSSTKGAGESVAGGLLPDWSNCYEIENDTARIFEVPLFYGAGLAPFLYSATSDGNLDIIRNDETLLQSHLVIQQFKATDSVRFFITTVVGNISDSTFVENQLSPFFWSGDRRGFRGYQFITDLGGELKVAYSYRNNARREVSFTVHGKSPSCPDAKNGGFGFFIERHPLTKGYDECPICWTPLYGADECPFCGYLIDELYIIEEGYTMCSMCFRPTHLCDCPECMICFSKPCLCEDPYEGCCPFCLNEYCSGECINMGGGGNYNPGNDEDTDTDVKYRVTVSCDGNGSVSGAEQGEYTENVTITLSAHTGAGSIFGGWVDNGTGELLSISESLSVLVDSHKDYTAHFYLESSECGRLVKKYKNNGNLRALVEELNNFKTNATLEHLVLKNTDGEYTKHIGESDNVKFRFNPLSTYEYIIHNHPSGSLIPSPEDLYTIYKADSLGLYSNEACFLIQTDNGTLSIEIEDRDTFELFALECLMTEAVRKRFKDHFHGVILGNPTNIALKSISVLNKSIAYYTQYGLKFAYTETDGRGTTWSYANVNSAIVTYNDCI